MAEAAHAERPADDGAVLVTAGGRRIGRAIAFALGRGGRPVAVHHNRSAEDAHAVVAEIERAGGRAAAFAADLRDEGAVTDLLPAVAHALGPVTGLVNNAAVFEPDGVADATRDGWDFHMAVNLRAPFVLAQGLLAGLPKDRTGAVVNIVDQRVRNPSPGFVTYTLSKMGLWDLTRILALEMAPRVRVNAIGPGPVLPGPRQDDEAFRQQWRNLPLARPVPPEEIADGVRFCLDAPGMTGQMIALDAGQHLCWAPPAAGVVPKE